MNEETKTKPKIASKDAVALAKAMFRVQNRKSDDNAGADGEKASFKDAKDEMLPLARRTLKQLKRQGYTLTKA